MYLIFIESLLGVRHIGSLFQITLFFSCYSFFLKIYENIQQISYLLWFPFLPFFSLVTSPRRLVLDLFSITCLPPSFSPDYIKVISTWVCHPSSLSHNTQVCSQRAGIEVLFTYTSPGPSTKFRTGPKPYILILEWRLATLYWVTWIITLNSHNNRWVINYLHVID